jgi:hypothetical protein
MKVKCQNCETVFEAQRTTAKFCSDKCRVQFNRKQKDDGLYFDARAAIFAVATKIEKSASEQLLRNLRDAIDEYLRDF